MEKWQERYIANIRRILELSNFYTDAEKDPDVWIQSRIDAKAECASLKEENISLLGRFLFPALDSLYSASEEDVASLEAFADVLMDWTTNLDCGIYCAIHGALLSVYRVRKDRNKVIRELYKLGMGYFYLRRFLNGVNTPEESAFAFRNEMLFTEAGTYIRYYDDIDDEETRGFIIRAMANVAIATKVPGRRIAASSRTLRITQDEHYRSLAPGLPWDAFVRKTHQQMSANRTELSRGNLTTEELAAVLDSCYEVFKVEEQSSDPGVRWLWPYYEMEYNCGYVSLETTLRRLEKLITDTPFDRYDMSGLYGNLQLAVYYGQLLKDNPKLLDDGHHIQFLNSAYRKMMHCLTTCPAEFIGDHFFFTLDVVITNYYEMPGVPSYREVALILLKRFGGENYIRFRKTGAMISVICEAICDQESDFFDDIPFISSIEDPEEKKKALLEYADECGLFFDFGLLKMNISRTMQSRNLFENEFRMYRQHSISGHDDLASRPSTQRFADIALGHHRWYDSSSGYPESYERTDSAYRQMTDIVAAAVYLFTEYSGDISAVVTKMNKLAGRRFSPMVTAYLADKDLLQKLVSILEDDGRAYYMELMENLQPS